MIKCKVEVSQQDIQRGKVSAEQCPVARAIKRSLRCRYAQVYAHSLYIKKGGKDYVSTVPRKVSRFIKRFDDGNIVKPLSFSCTFTEY